MAASLGASGTWEALLYARSSLVAAAGARAIVAASNKGAGVVHGRMVDEAMALRARRLLDATKAYNQTT